MNDEQRLLIGWRATTETAVVVARTTSGRWLKTCSVGPDICRPDVETSLQWPGLIDSGCIAVLTLQSGESLTSLWLQGHVQPLVEMDLRGRPYLAVVDQLLSWCQPGLTPKERMTCFLLGLVRHCYPFLQL